jgi:RhtB (resistance to homoserine/threonine) family protein
MSALPEVNNFFCSPFSQGGFRVVSVVDFGEAKLEGQIVEYITPIVTIAVISLLAAMSPGPDLAVVTKNSLFGSRSTGLYTAIGVSLGILLHVTYSLLGVGLIISQSIVLFTIIKYIGAMYLLYLGWQLLRAKRESTDVVIEQQLVMLSPFAALKEGVLTNAFNPKATLFFLSIFTQVVDPETPILFQAFLGIEVAVVVGVWFVALAFIISYEPIKNTFEKAHYYLMKFMGVALILLGVRLALETKE